MLLVVGQIVRPHGIRGEVVVDVRTDEPAQRFAAGSVLVTDPAVPPRSGRLTSGSYDRSGPRASPCGPDQSPLRPRAAALAPESCSRRVRFLVMDGEPS